MAPAVGEHAAPCSSSRNTAARPSATSTASATSRAAASRRSARATASSSSCRRCRARPTVCSKLAKQITRDPRRARAGRHRVDRRAGQRRPAWRSPSRRRAARRVSLLGHQVRILTDSAFARARIQDIDARAIERRAGQRQDRRHRRLSGRRQGRQHHDAGPRRLRHVGRGDRGGAEGRRLRDLHRRRRRLHGGSERRQQRAQDRSHQLRGDAGAGVAGREGAADPFGRIRHEVRRADSRPFELQRQRRDVGRARGESHGSSDGLRCHRDEGRGQDHPAQDRRRAGGAGQGVQAAGRRRHRRRRHRAGVHPGRAHQPDLHAVVGGSGARAGRPDQGVRGHLHAASRSRPSRTCRRCRSSASACARTRASR